MTSQNNTAWVPTSTVFAMRQSNALACDGFRQDRLRRHATKLRHRALRRGCQAPTSDESTGVVEIKTRQSLKDAGRVAETEIDEEIGRVTCVREKSLVNEICLETGHRAGVETEGARRHNEISALQRSIPKRSFLRRVGAGREPRPCVRVRKESGKLVIEKRVLRNDDRNGRIHCLFEVGARERRWKLLLPLPGADEDESRRATIV